jgi:hypothetical protein|nr:MAG TPA: Protein of unknown function (DUF1366) [Caudoviricetes sp.]
MTFTVVNKFLQGNNRTFVAIRQEEPYTAFDRVLIGDRTNESNDDLIKAVLAQVTTEFNPADGVKQLQEDLITQEQAYNQKLAEKEAQIAEVKAIANWSVLARVTDTDNPLDPTLYKKGLELVDLGQTGKTYQAQEIFTIENPNHVEQYQEGKRVMVQVTEPFTYQGQTLEQLEELHQNGKIGLWKWEAPTVKPSSELDTQPVQ